MAKTAHQFVHDVEVAFGCFGVDVDGGAAGDPLHHFQPDLADGEDLAEQFELAPGRPAADVQVGAEAQRMNRQADDVLDCVDAAQIDDGDDLAQLTGAIAATAVAIVSVFMVVGGVVIMNIMLAVVSERTREIGIRKAVGARRSDILSQFVIESAMMSATGGLIGVLIAWGLAVLVRNLTAIPMSVPISAVLLGVGLSTAVGVFFGVYPARQAAKLDPIEALRAET